VGSLGKTSSLISIKVDIIDVEGGCFKGRNAENGITVDGETAVAKTVSYNVGFGFLSEFKVDLDFMILHLYTLPFGIFLDYLKEILNF